MVRLNPNFEKLGANYLFRDIREKTKAFQEKHPDARIIKLGIGDTTLPLTPTIVQAMHEAVDELGNPNTYQGYGDEPGQEALRKSIAEKHYGDLGIDIPWQNVFVSDGAKPDTSNIQTLFGQKAIVAVQDPVYPVYVDTNVIAGRTESFDKHIGRYPGLVYMPCTFKNGFFPSLGKVGNVDLIYFCSPNNPTGAVATQGQLEELVDFAISKEAIIVFDAAYQAFIRDKELPRSILGIKGARDCCIEVNSFSKSDGFTGVRLGWTVILNEKLRNMWLARQSRFFNGASYVAQAGGLAALTEQGKNESKGLIDEYMDRAGIIATGLDNAGLKYSGGKNAPYLWVKTPGGMGSWEFFDHVLERAQVVGTPGAGFGPNGEGYFRFSAFGSREEVEEAAGRIATRL